VTICDCCNCDVTLNPNFKEIINKIKEKKKKKKRGKKQSPMFTILIFSWYMGCTVVQTLPAKLSILLLHLFFLSLLLE